MNEEQIKENNRKTRRSSLLAVYTLLTIKSDCANNIFLFGDLFSMCLFHSLLTV